MIRFLPLLFGAIQGAMLAYVIIHINFPELISIVLWIGLHYYHTLNGHYGDRYAQY